MKLKMKLRSGLRPATAHMNKVSHLQRLSFLAVVNLVFGVVSVLHSQTVVPTQVNSQGAGPSTQMDLRSARVAWKSTTNTQSVIRTPSALCHMTTNHLPDPK